MSKKSKKLMRVIDDMNHQGQELMDRYMELSDYSDDLDGALLEKDKLIKSFEDLLKSKTDQLRDADNVMKLLNTSREKLIKQNGQLKSAVEALIFVADR